MSDSEERRNKSRTRRWLEDWATMTGASVIIVGAIVGGCEALGIEFPLVLEKAYAQDQKETHKQMVQLSQEVVGVKQQIERISTDFLKRDQRDLQREIRDLNVQLAQASNGPEVRRLLNEGLDKAAQDLKQVNAELMRRGVQ